MIYVPFQKCNHWLHLIDWITDPLLANYVGRIRKRELYHSKKGALMQVCPVCSTVCGLHISCLCTLFFRQHIFCNDFRLTRGGDNNYSNTFELVLPHARADAFLATVFVQLCFCERRQKNYITTETCGWKWNRQRKNSFCADPEHWQCQPLGSSMLTIQWTPT